MNAAEWILAHRWAMLPEMLQTIIRVATREISLADMRQTIAPRDGEPLEGTRRVEMFGNVAVIPVIGPIFPRGNLFSMVSGGTSISLLAKDFTRAVEDPQVEAIVLNIDSPGGEITGVNELGEMIYSARGKKPLVTYGYGMVASAAYWMGSATDKIVLDATAEAGSIGVVSAFTDYSEWDKKNGIKEIEIVSSQSPKKRLRPTSKDGRDYIQNIVDELADVFVSTVSRNRGVSEETVLMDFGAGGVKVAKSAVEAGLADEIGSLESVIESLSTSSPKGGFSMDISEFKSKHPEVYEQVRTDALDEGKRVGLEEGKKQAIADLEAATKEAREAGAKQERERIQGIEGLKKAGPTAAKVVEAEKFNPMSTKESVSVQILENQGEAVGQVGAAMAADGTELAATLVDVADQPGDGPGESEEEAYGRKAAEEYNKSLQNQQ